MLGYDGIKTVIYSTALRGVAREKRGTILCLVRSANVESQDPRNTRDLLNSDVRCYECSVRRSIRLSEPFDRTAVKHGNTASFFSSIQDDTICHRDLTPVDPAGGHRYRNSIKTCESRVVMDSADCSVTRG